METTYIQLALFRLATRLCREQQCGIKDAPMGRKNRGLRCSNCPLDDVQDVWDSYAAKHPGEAEDE